MTVHFYTLPKIQGGLRKAMLSRSERLHWLSWHSSTEIVAEIARTGYLKRSGSKRQHKGVPYSYPNLARRAPPHPKAMST
jgi:hypothetical protein